MVWTWKNIFGSLGAICTFIGAIDLPDQIQRWAKYLVSMAGIIVNWDADILGSGTRWAFVIFGMILMFIAFDVPGRLRERWESFKRAPTSNLAVRVRQIPDSQKEVGSKILRSQKDEKQSEEIPVQRREPTILSPSNTPILRAVPIQEDKPERVFIGENITPDYLIGLFDDPGRTTFQGETLLQPFIGKWMKLSGTMKDVSDHHNGIAIMTFRLAADPNSRHFTTYHMLFRGEPIQRIIILKQGDKFTAIGQIYSVSRTQFVMDNCEILD